MSVVDVKDIELDKHCKSAADDAWAQHADGKPSLPADEKQSPEQHDEQQQSEPVLPHHHVVDLFDLSEYDDRSYCDIAEEYTELMQNLKANDKLLNELKSFMKDWTIRGISTLHKCAKDMSGSKHRQMLSPEVLSVLDSLSSDQYSQTDERQALVLAFEAMCELGALTEKLKSLDVLQRYRLLLQLRTTPKWSHLHCFIGMGSWEDNDLQEILSSLGYKVVNNHLQWRCKTTPTPKDKIRAWIISLVFLETFNE